MFFYFHISVGLAWKGPDFLPWGLGSWQGYRGIFWTGLPQEKLVLFWKLLDMVLSIICLIFEFISRKEKSGRAPSCKWKCYEGLQDCFPKGQPMSFIISTSVLYNFLYSTIIKHNLLFKYAVVEDNHVHKLIKLISQHYCTIRLHHISKSVNE